MTGHPTWCSTLAPAPWSCSIKMGSLHPSPASPSRHAREEALRDAQVLAPLRRIQTRPVQERRLPVKTSHLVLILLVIVLLVIVGYWLFILLDGYHLYRFTL